MERQERFEARLNQKNAVRNAEEGARVADQIKLLAVNPQKFIDFINVNPDAQAFLEEENIYPTSSEDGTPTYSADDLFGEGWQDDGDYLRAITNYFRRQADQMGIPASFDADDPGTWEIPTGLAHEKRVDPESTQTYIQLLTTAALDATYPMSEEWQSGINEADMSRFDIDQARKRRNRRTPLRNAVVRALARFNGETGIARLVGSSREARAAYLNQQAQFYSDTEKGNMSLARVTQKFSAYIPSVRSDPDNPDSVIGYTNPDTLRRIYVGMQTLVERGELVADPRDQETWIELIEDHADFVRGEAERDAARDQQYRENQGLPESTISIDGREMPRRRIRPFGLEDPDQ